MVGKGEKDQRKKAKELICGRILPGPQLDFLS